MKQSKDQWIEESERDIQTLLCGVVVDVIVVDQSDISFVQIISCCAEESIHED